MNLHVTFDTYGLYPLEIAERIKNSEFCANNMMVNLSQESQYKHDIIDYIDTHKIAYKKYVSNLTNINKVIFHPYNRTTYEFLKILLQKFPNVKVYWICWSYEIYNLPHVVNKLYEPFSLKYIKSKITLRIRLESYLKKIVKKFLELIKVRKNYWQILSHSNSLVDYFCSPFPTDFYYLNNITVPNKIKYEAFAYLSLPKIMPELDKYRSTGNKIMIGHAASPEGNHYEVIKKISSLSTNCKILLPLVYGDKQYGSFIQEIAKDHFDDIEVLEKKMDKVEYYTKLCEVAWAVINVKVQQAVGNIIGLVWMGAKVFLNENSSVYIDFKKWGIKVFNIQHDLCLHELETKLTDEEVKINRKVLLEKFGDNISNQYWEKILR